MTPSAESPNGEGPKGFQLPYDPDMDAAETRKIRKEYRDVLATQAETRANLSAYKVSDLITDLGKVDTIFSGVKRAQEATLDSKAVNNLSEMAALKARAMKHSAGGFDTDDFLLKLVTYMGGRSSDVAASSRGDDHDEDGDSVLDWEKIGYLVLRKSRRVMGMNFMFGPLSIEQKTRTPAKRGSNKINKDPKDNVIPDEVNTEEMEKEKNENDTTSNVKQINNLLSAQGQAVNYFRFIINPDSFEQSVENMFYFSFLIRDGLAAWDFSADMEPIVWASEAPTEQDYQENLQRKQAVLEFDYATWEQAIQVFDIRKPIIPTRPPIPDDKKFPKFGKPRYSQSHQSDPDEDGEGDEEPEDDILEDD